MVKNVQQDHNKRNDICPYIDDNDARCGYRFSLGRIDQAFSVCLGSFHGCPMFHRLNREASIREGQEGRSKHVTQPTTTITAEGEILTLQPTGT